MSKISESEVRLDTFFDTLTADLNASPYVHYRSKERLLARMRKRARFVNKDLEPEAVYQFLRVNSLKSGFRHSLTNDVLIEARWFITRALENYTTSITGFSIQQTLYLPQVLASWRFGPRTSFGNVGKHPAEKIEEPMGCTDLCEPYVKRLRASNTYFSAEDRLSKDGGRRIVLGSKLSTVPKNEDTMRTIAIEPSGNMCMQLAAGTYLEGTLRHIGLDIKKQQPLNKALARLGSFDGSLATLDLSSASDHISPDLVRALFPREWYDLLMEIRSPTIRVNGEFIEQNMMSTMGNGFTFPLMTLIIVSLIYANKRISHSGPSLFINWSDTAVYGDDIIIPVKEYLSVVDVLQRAGFVVNKDKSYGSGPFRESCGGDYWDGVDITPFYVQSLATDSEIYVAINQLTLWSSSRDFIPTTSLRYLVSLLRKGPYFVPFWLSPTAGVHTTEVSRRYKYLKPIGTPRTYTGRYGMMLACGGYLEDNGLGPFYLPVSDRKPRYSTKGARLPRGYLDGSDIVKTASAAMKSNINLMLTFL